jgi:linoleoyl-CoA desaturase
MRNENIKYISDDKQKQFASTLRRNVKDYFDKKGISMKGNLGLMIKTGIMISIYLVPFILLLILPMNIWEGILMAVLMGIGAAGVGMGVMHDAVHGSFSKKKWVNNLFGGTLYLLGSNVNNWKIQHNILHHTHTNINGLDQDINSKGPIRLSEHARYLKIHRFQFIYAFFFYGLMTFSKLISDFSNLIDYSKAGLTAKQGVNPKTEMLKMILYKSVYLLIILGLPIWLTGFTWWQVLLGFFIMHWTVGIILSVIFQMAHVVEGAEQPEPDENGVVHCDWAIHQLKTTSDFARNNLFLGWYIGGLNFQIEHHLFPNISHIHYRNLSRIVEKTAKDFGLTYNLKPTFFSAFASHVRRLKALGRPPVTT